MPSFGWRYDDAEIAEIATFIRASWSNGGTPVTAAKVAAIRSRSAPLAGR